MTFIEGAIADETIVKLLVPSLATHLAAMEAKLTQRPSALKLGLSLASFPCKPFDFTLILLVLMLKAVV